MLSEDTQLNATNIAEILRHGYTRIPVYSVREKLILLSFFFSC